MDDYYTLLDVDPAANTETIADRIREQLQIWRERATDPVDHRREPAEHRLRLITHARAVLLSEDKRRNYDLAMALELARSGKPGKAVQWLERRYRPARDPGRPIIAIDRDEPISVTDRRSGAARSRRAGQLLAEGLVAVAEVVVATAGEPALVRQMLRRARRVTSDPQVLRRVEAAEQAAAGVQAQAAKPQAAGAGAPEERTPGDQRPHPGVEPDHWWLRVGAEPARPSGGCGAPDCDPSGLAPTDAYCYSHERPVRAGTTARGRGAQVVAYTLRIALCGLFVLAAEGDTAIPLFAAGALVGGALLARPLLRFRTTRNAVVTYWILACLVVLLLRDAPADTAEFVVIFAVQAAALAVVIYFGQVARHGGWSGLLRNHRPVPRLAVPLAPRLVAICAGYTAAALLALVAWDVVGLLLTVPPFLPDATLVAAQVAAAITVAVTAVSGVVLGARRINRDVRRLVPRPAPPTLYDWRPHSRPRRPPRSASWEDRIAAVVNDYAQHATRVAAAAARTATNFVIVFFHVLALILTAFVNWAYRRLVLAIRRGRAAVGSSVRVVGHASRIFATAAVRTARVVLLPLVALAEAAWLLLVMAEAGRSFLVDGAPAAFAGMAVTAGGAALVLTVTWLALAGQPLVASIGSAVRSGAITAAAGLVFLAVGGWIVGLPGTLGYWRIHVGWVTIGATVVAVAAYLWSLRRRRTPDDQPPPVTATAAADAPTRPATNPVITVPRAPVGGGSTFGWGLLTVSLGIVLLVCAANLVTPTG